MFSFKHKNFFKNEEPIFLAAGEIHYFRLKRNQWQSALDHLKESGCNTVATYIPWICHEFEENKFDLTGRFREEHDIKGFIELCIKNNFYLFLRPGPYIMAEMKNEGIPYWVSEKYPDVVPTTWDGKNITTKTLDYLNPNFLEASKNWYEEIMGLISHYLDNVVGVQLDNEVGMLSWVSNCPDFTDLNLKLFVNYLQETYSPAELTSRYHFSFENFETVQANLRSPNEGIGLTYHKDLGYFMRDRFKTYIYKLKGFAEEAGIADVPFFINIHGSGGNRGTGYPMGVSQLMDVYRNSNDIVSGIDFYIGEINIGNFQDVYLANIFTDCLNSEDQPLTAIEFETGDGDYGFNFDNRYSPSSIDIKTRMFLAQGNKLFNYYLFSGGENYRFSPSKHDGNDRIAITGQKHGFAAPINFDLQEGSVYNQTIKTIKTSTTNMLGNEMMQEEYDNLVFAFIPDYYMTEYFYTDKEKEMIEEIKSVRDGGMWKVLAKSLLLLNYRFKAVDVQNKTLVDEIKNDTTLVLTSALYMPPKVQMNVVDFIKNGGNVLIYGKLPIYDMEGNTCTILSDFVGVKNVEVNHSRMFHYPSVCPCGFAEAYPDVQNEVVQTYDVEEAEVFLRFYDDNRPCGFTKIIENSKIAVLTAEYHSQLPVMEKLFEFVGMKHSFSHNYRLSGIFITSTKLDEKRFIHVINLDDFDKEIDIFENGEVVYKKLRIGRKDCLMLPLNIPLISGVTVIKSTAEVFEKNKNFVKFRLTQNTDFITFKTDKNITSSDEIDVKNNGVIKTVKIFSKAKLNDILELKFN